MQEIGITLKPSGSSCGKIEMQIYSARSGRTMKSCPQRNGVNDTERRHGHRNQSGFVSWEHDGRHDRPPKDLSASESSTRSGKAAAMDDSLIVGRFKSSSGSEEYIVRKDTLGRAACTCPGFRFHRKCRHIEACQGVTVTDRDIVSALKDGEDESLDMVRD